MSFIDDFSHTVDRACDNAMAALRKKLGVKDFDGSDTDPAAPRDSVDSPLSEQTLDEAVDHALADEDLRAAIRARISEKWL